MANLLIVTHIVALLVGGGVGYYVKKVGAKTALAQVQAAGQTFEDLAKRL